MGKKLKGGRRQILQLEEKKPPQAPKYKMKNLIHYSDSDDDSKKSNESNSSSTVLLKKEETPLDSEVADFFKEIDALSVPEELLEQTEGASSSTVEVKAVNEITSEDHNSKSQLEFTVTQNESGDLSEKQNEGTYCTWQEICDDSTGYSYYWNVQTNEVTWDCPAEYAIHVQSINATSTEILTKDGQSNEQSMDKNYKKVKKKKDSLQLADGAIVPISYFGKSSSDNSSDDEGGSSKLQKKHKSEAATDSKRTKVSKKSDVKLKLDEIQFLSELIGPQLPPDFPVSQSVLLMSEEITSTIVPRNEVKFDTITPSLPQKGTDFQEKSSQSDFNGYPTESSANETSQEVFLKDSENKLKELDAETDDKSHDSIAMKEDNYAMNCTPSQESNIAHGLRLVVEYDSYTDEDEDICVSNKSVSRQMQATDKNPSATKNSSDEESGNVSKSDTVMSTKSEAENEVNSSKRKAADEFKLNMYEDKVQKKAKKNDAVDIDELFAAHSSYGKYGFGFGWQKQPHVENADIGSTSRQNHKSCKSQNEFKAISFVKSEDVLNLKILNDNFISDVPCHVVLDESCEKYTESSFVGHTEEKCLDDDEKVKTLEKVIEVEDAKVTSKEDICSLNILVLKDEHIDAIRNKKRDRIANRGVSCTAKLAASEIAEDLDEIDKALCEALDAKKAKQSPLLSSLTAPFTNLKKSNFESSRVTPFSKSIETERSDSEHTDDADLMENIFERTSSLIDKLTFLISKHSTLTSLSSFLIQLQIRFVDWQAGALDSKYFMARLKEVNQYIEHYEMDAISGDWTYQWDRVNKRYFYLNNQTQHSQWTHPKEQCSVEKSQEQSQPEASASNAPNVNELDDHQCVSSSMHKSLSKKHSTSNFVPKDGCVGSNAACSNLLSSPPPPPPGVDSPPPPPLPPDSPPPPPPDSTETERELEDMDLENSNDSSTCAFFHNKNGPDDRIQYSTVIDQSSRTSPVNAVNSSVFNPVSSTSIPKCEDRNLLSELSQSISPSLNSSEIIMSDSGVVTPISTNVHVHSSEEKVFDICGSSNTCVSTSQPDVVQPKLNKPGGTVLKKKKTKIQPGLGLKKKNIPSLVEKWQKIKEEQEREEKDSDDSRSSNSF